MFFFVLLIQTCFLNLYGKEFTIGMIWQRANAGYSLAYQRTASTFTIALEDAKRQGLLNNVTIRVLKYFAENGQESIGEAVDMIIRDDVDLVFGHASSRANIPIAYMTSHYNIPHISWSSLDVTLSDKDLFRTFVRTSGTMQKVGTTVIEIMAQFGWRRLGIFGEDTGLCLYGSNSIVQAVQNTNITIAYYKEFDMVTFTDQMIIDQLKTLKSTVRIAVVCSIALIRKIVIFACQLGMCNGEFVFIDPLTVIGEASYSPWQVGDSQDSVAKEAYKHVIKIFQSLWTDEATKQWQEDIIAEVPLRMHEEPWNNTEATDNGYTGSARTSLFYNAAYVWFFWLNYTQEYNLDHRDGRAMFEFTHNLTFAGPDGTVNFDGNGDREPAFWIMDWKNSSGVSRIMATVDIKSDNAFKFWLDPMWMTADGLPPPDIPPCGFDGNKCPAESYDALPVVIGTVIPAVAVAVVSILIWMYYKKHVYERELMKMLWKVDYNEIHKNKGLHLGAHGSFFSKLSVATLSVTEEDAIFTKTGKYKGVMVAIRMSTTETITLNRQDFVELQAMKEMTHDNINSFIGACIDPPNCCVLFQYCSKGSLQDVLQNDDIALDWTFKMSMVSDCLEGLIYLSSSVLKSCGNLKSSNCLVDNRWVVKLTDYGLYTFRRSHLGKEEYEEEKFKALLWMAPELLRTPLPPRNGTQAGDVYSFGIILHEIYYRMGVFPISTLTAREIVTKVKTGGTGLCRPMTDVKVSDEKPALIDLMINCWAEDPMARPNFATMKNALKREYKGKKTGIMDNMILMLEKYANNLEDLVSQRTMELSEEKQKTDRLLYRMLPKTVAEKLKSGKTVDPESFDIVTIFFSDIVGFTRISACSSPMQIVDFLNDLYTLFDDVIATFDVYKVETIGDAYMVVGGLSRSGGNKHASEIADMSLTILSSVLSFKLKHMPNELLRVRVGLHSGACCAGVVGLTMPRYCLFGDTVNTASRMESNGEAQKIHISSATRIALQSEGGYHIQLRGEVPIKGKGSMTTYWLYGKDHFDKPLPIIE